MGETGTAMLSAGAVATVIAALLTAVVSMSVSTIGGARMVRLWRWDDHHRRRDQYWGRLAWALDMAASDDAERSTVGVAVLAAVYDMPWITAEDRVMTTMVFDHLLTAKGRRR